MKLFLANGLFGLSALFVLVLLGSEALGSTLLLNDIDSALTPPPGKFRWLDVADQAYSTNYRTSYNYTQAFVEVTYDQADTTLHGTLHATDLKPNFAYQLKLVGVPGTPANEGIGLAGRWWQEKWSGSEWTGGKNLNNKGDGSSPNPNDDTYFARRDIVDETSPTGLKYRYTGYLVFDYFVTDEAGDAMLTFEVNSSYHVLWKTLQRSRTDADGPLKSTTFDADLSAAYDDTGGDDFEPQTIGIFGEWERLPVGAVYLPTGDYPAQITLTEESFHGSGGSLAGNWAGAMDADIEFSIVPCKGDFDQDGDVDGSDLAVFLAEFGVCTADCLADFEPDGDVDAEDLALFAEHFARTNCPTSP